MVWFWALSAWASPGATPAPSGTVSRIVGDGLVVTATVIWALLALAFISRAVRFPHSVLQEMRHPVRQQFCQPVSGDDHAGGHRLCSLAAVPLSLVLFAIGVVLQLSYAAWQSAGLWRGKHPNEATTPGLYLPTVANNFISAMACGALGFTDAGLVFLGAGLFSWLSLEPVILQRLRSDGELPMVHAHRPRHSAGAGAGGVQRLAERERRRGGYLR
ncbi:hypothetical protein QYS46_16040 [Klebsiella michiganensis]|nr:hypothetical protein [Klebsiella michiganensis]